MTTRIAVVGSMNMDLVVRAPHIPQPGETIIGSGFHTVPGGKGANQAVAASRLGARVAMVGRVGSDPFGDVLIHNLASAGVDPTFAARDAEAATGVALIVVEDSGQNSIVVAPGANMRLTAADVEAASSVIANARMLLLQLESPLECVIRAAELAKAHRVTVVLNPAPAPTFALPDRLLALVDVLIPNESETARLTGLPVTDLAATVDAAGALLATGVGIVILTLGERGAVLARAEGTQLFPAFAVTPVDSTAAGDAFVGGFAVALAEGRPLEEAVRWGNAAGALATTKLGAQPSLPTREALEAFLGS